jgi:hypothetical protein
MKTGAQEARSEQVPTRQTPEHGSLETGRNPCGKQGGTDGELGGEPSLDHLVKCASGEAASRQIAIDVAEAERQGLGLLRPTFQLGDPVP